MTVLEIWAYTVFFFTWTCDNTGWNTKNSFDEQLFLEFMILGTRHNQKQISWLKYAYKIWLYNSKKKTLEHHLIATRFRYLLTIQVTQQQNNNLHVERKKVSIRVNDCYRIRNQSVKCSRKQNIVKSGNRYSELEDSLFKLLFDLLPNLIISFSFRSFKL